MRTFIFLLSLFLTTSVFADERVKVDLTEVVNISQNKLYKPISFEMEAEETKSVKLFLEKQSYPSSVIYIYFDGKNLYFTEARGMKRWMVSRATRHNAAIKVDSSQVEFELIRVKNTEFSGKATRF